MVGAFGKKIEACYFVGQGLVKGILCLNLQVSDDALS